MSTTKGACIVLLLHIGLVLIAILVYRNRSSPSDSIKMADDPCSLSNPHQAIVTNWHLVATPDFSTKKLSAVITVDVTVKSDTTNTLILDTRDLTINKVTDVRSGNELSYELKDVYKNCPAFGAPLVINLPSTALEATSTIAIQYETSPLSSAIQWLEPAQTAGKKHPYLFTQCQAIHCRSLMPCQDTPSVKSTYTAEIKVNKELTALMSAVRKGEHLSETEPELKVYKFEQKVPIPSYLTALVVGALESRKIGPRTHVWSEKEFVEKGAFEFSQTEDMLAAAENIVGPYLWGVYDLLVLPPSFPYGGMENPCLTFVTPTLLAGDKSLANVIAHEISHSWTGNLVTNKNWEHFWLNEGFTRYLESLIVAAVWDEKERQLQSMLGWKSLKDSIEKFGSSNPLTALVPKLIDIDPDDAFSSVPYEKGFALLYYLETIVGLDEMKKYLRAHVENFKYKTIDSNQWKEFFLKYFEQKGMLSLFDGIDWKTWFYEPGLPPYELKYEGNEVSKLCTALAEKWYTSSDGEGFSLSDLEDLSSTQIQEFLNQLLNKPQYLSKEMLKKFEEVYKMNERTNSEIKFRWLSLALKGNYTDVFPLVTSFVLEQGRMKFVRPLYRELFKCPGGKDLAVQTFTANRHIYHSIAANMIAKDLGLQ